ncbi:GNAT family N-acetyltransferase [Mesorhizobium sp. BAC0120]|uniref:GNAT family N-acetyltransferase n=1 Tax=Mesorhizobium sp. BAC0120 TaxID=3090670 RepID=UPI00298C60EE|nr:GNAT family N-acetyltransferase [Mesorhizobium sp. BAC0120]MDW6021635.1 GNAT family N-acetyltransferase [Mesorhizobium sp. BAC0120]
MSGYFGTEMQRRLQAQAEANVAFSNATPGLCQTGRTMGCDDTDRLGWERIEQFIDRDGVCGFRLIPAGKAEELKSRLAERNFRFDTWDVFLADRATALAASETIVSRGPPNGLIDLERPTDPEGEYTARIQALMGGAGVVPFSGSLLVGAFGPATTLAVGDDKGAVLAAAHGYLPHNTYSPYHGYAWGGLVAVAQSQRGKGLGNYVNARMIVSVFRELDATHIYELVSPSNVPSRRMVESCGLRPEPDLVCGIATSNDSASFTR